MANLIKASIYFLRELISEMTLKILILNMWCLKNNYDKDRQNLKTYIWTIMTGLERECFLFTHINTRNSGHNLWRKYRFGPQNQLFHEFQLNFTVKKFRYILDNSYLSIIYL